MSFFAQRMRQRGAAPIELALGVGLLMIPMAMIVLSFGPGLEIRSFVRQAAAEASRSVVLSDGDVANTVTQIAAMAANHGLEPADVRLGLCGAAPQPLTSGGGSACPVPLPRGLYVQAVIEMDAPSITVPGIGVDVGGFVISTRHESLVDLYKSVDVP